jgi:hypothetical protein
MEDFYDLRKPQKEPAGMNAGDWFVIAARHPHGAALVNDGTYELKLTGWTEEDNAKFYFETESDAYLASVTYYTKHGKLYPNLMDCTSGSDPKEKDDIQQEMMEFK